jgi:hypothetical protein
MAKKKLVSATLTAETKADVLDKIASVKKSLDFLLTLQTSEVHTLLKLSKEQVAFLDKAYNAATEHSDILPPVFNLEEFKKFYQIMKDLIPIVDAINELADSLKDTQMALNSDVMLFALEIYAAVKQSKGKVLGLNVIADAMGEFFKKTKKTTTAAATTT